MPSFLTLSLRGTRTSQQWEHTTEMAANFIVARKKRDGARTDGNIKSIIYQLIDPQKQDMQQKLDEMDLCFKIWDKLPDSIFKGKGDKGDSHTCTLLSKARDFL